MIDQDTSYIGRFAPSPTGPLHFGSLVAALASWLDARAHGGVWLVRVEDLDPPRESPEAATRILDALEVFGLEWDGSVLYQSTRLAAYQEALDRLIRSDLIYPCTCARTRGGEAYDGHCRGRSLDPAPTVPFALRVRVGSTRLSFDDLVRGTQESDLERDAGDFVVRRKEGLFAYQLAVVVDDAWQKITRVVRGSDLLDSTARQLYLQQCLGYPHPEYAHIPLIVDEHGNKLSKQTFAAPLTLAHPARYILAALAVLGISAPAGAATAGPAELLAWAITAWDLDRIPPTPSIPASSVPHLPAD